MANYSGLFLFLNTVHSFALLEKELNFQTEIFYKYVKTI